MKELWEYCLEDRRDTMEVAVGNRRCTETSPTPNLFKPIQIQRKREDKPDGRGAKEEGALPKGGGG